MRFSTIAVAAAATAVNAQRPSDTPICDYYTTALLKNNTAENQATLLTLLVNTVVIGNCASLSHPVLARASDEQSRCILTHHDRHHAQCRRLGARYPQGG